MTTATATRPSSGLSGRHRKELEPGCERERSQHGGERFTLETRISGVWEGLLAAGLAECPVCAGEFRRMGDLARCAGCGSELYSARPAP